MSDICISISNLLNRFNSLINRLAFPGSFYSFRFFIFSTVMDLTFLVDDIRQTAAVSSLPSGQAEAECSGAVAAIPSAVKAVQKILQLTGDTLPEICRHIESVPTQVALKSAFARLNDTMRFFLELPASPQDHHLIGEAVCELGVSEKLRACISEEQSLDAALKTNKTRIISALA